MKALPESDTADMEFFLDQVTLILPVLGFTFTQPVQAFAHPMAPGISAASPVFVIQSVGIAARAREVGDEFIVLRGSTARKTGVPSWTSYSQLRDELVANGALILSERPDYYVFVEDTPFTSPSAAAAVVQARNANGRLDGKAEGSGQSYQEWSATKVDRSIRDSLDARVAVSREDPISGMNET